MNRQQARDRIADLRIQRSALNVATATLETERAELRTKVTLLTLKISQNDVVVANINEEIAQIVHAGNTTPDTEQGKPDRDPAEVLNSLTPEQRVVVQIVANIRTCRPEQPGMVQDCQDLLRLGVLEYAGATDTYRIAAAYKGKV